MHITLMNNSHGIRYLTTPEKVSRLQYLQRQRRLKMERLKSKLASIISTQGVSVDDEMSDDMCTMMEEEEGAVREKFAEGSFQQIF